MSVLNIEIPDNPSLLQMQEMQFLITKRMNAFVLMTVVQVEDDGVAAFTFADQNDRLSIPTLDDVIREIEKEKEDLANVT